MKPQNPAKPWSPKDFFGGSGYYTHNTQGYLAKPESLVVPSRSPPAECTAEDQSFFHVPRNPEDPRTGVDISSGSASLTASQLIDQEAMSCKNAAAASTALSLAEYIDNYPGMPEGARAVILLLKLDIISCLNYTWREAHNKMPLRPLGKPSVIFEGTRIKVINNEGVLPPQITPVGGRLSNFVEGWKRITNDPYVLSIVAKGYRLRFTSPPLLRQTPWEIRYPKGPEKILGMREQITLMLQKNVITEVPPNSPGFYSNVFLVQKASGGWRPVIDLKNLNAHIHAPHLHMFTTSSVLSSNRKGDYAFKIDLQDAYFHVPIHPSSRKYLRFTFREQGVPVSGATLRSEHSPSGFYSTGAHVDRLSSPSGDLSDTISRRLVDSPPGPPNSTPTSGSAHKYSWT